MKLQEIRIKNFRAFRDQTIQFNDYTCLAGPNGSGKSTILSALAVFFQDQQSSRTNVKQLSDEDFHNKDTSQPIEIILTFENLSAGAQTDLKDYYRQGKLVVTAKAEWNDQTKSATVKQYGTRTGIKLFAPFFEQAEGRAGVPLLKGLYNSYRGTFPDLPTWSSKEKTLEALRKVRGSTP